MITTRKWWNRNLHQEWGRGCPRCREVRTQTTKSETSKLPKECLSQLNQHTSQNPIKSKKWTRIMLNLMNQQHWIHSFDKHSTLSRTPNAQAHQYIKTRSFPNSPLSKGRTLSSQWTVGSSPAIPIKVYTQIITHPWPMKCFRVNGLGVGKARTLIMRQWGSRTLRAQESICGLIILLSVQLRWRRI